MTFKLAEKPQPPFFLSKPSERFEKSTLRSSQTTIKIAHAFQAHRTMRAFKKDLITNLSCKK